MFICKIFDSGKQQVCEFKTDEKELGKSISVGKSPKCLVSLPETCAVEGMHFAIVNKDNVWKLENPGNDVSLINGKHIEDIELDDSMVIVFGSCLMKVEKEKLRSKFDLAWETGSDDKVERAPLYEGTNLVGSAEYCDIIVKSDEVGSEHLNVVVHEVALMIEDLNSGFRTNYKNNNITKPTAVEQEKTFFIGSLPAKIITKDLPGNTLSFKSQVISWHLLNIVLLSLALFLIVIVAWDRISENEPSEKRYIDEKFDDQREKLLIADIKEAIKNGTPSYALEEIAVLQKNYKENKKYNHLERALALELNSIENMNLFKVKVKEALEQNLKLSYIKYILSAKDAEEQLEDDIKFWKNVSDKLESLEKKISTQAQPYFKNIGANSYFLSHYGSLKTDISKIYSQNNNYLQLFIVWKKEEWKKAINLLNTIKETSTDKSGAKLKSYLSNTIATAEFAWEIQENTEKFSNADFMKFDSRKLKTQLESYYSRFKKLPKTFPLGNIKDKLDLLKTSNNLLIEFYPLYLSWEKDPENITKLTKLAKFVNNKSFYDSKMKIMLNSYSFVNKKIYKYISESINKIEVRPDKKALKECNKLEQYLIIMGSFGTGVSYQELQKKQEEITRAINTECDNLFSRFQMEKEKGDVKNMKNTLKQILKKSPEDSHYRKWATKEMMGLE